MVDYYNLLGIAPDAAPDEVRRAFRARAKAVHPDAHPHGSPVEQEAQRRRFIALAQAYETLSDPDRREAYDRTWRAGLRPAGAAPGARAGAGPGWRQTHASFGRARRNPPRGAGAQAAPGESLNELLRDMEGLLGRFGLDLRTPLEALLDALMDWARAIYREVLVEGAGTGGATKAPPRGARAGAKGAAARDTTAGHGGERRDSHADRRAARAAEADGVEEELSRLKERMGKKP
ncbi:MAG TPA: J domain-containing protein [bacterium]|nr:J domain-containing protein [bacterium]